MVQNSIESRRKQYFKLSSQIAQLDNTQLRSLFDISKSNESGTGWGMNHTVVLEQSTAFVKRVPVTNLEYDNLFSTRNLYDLPTACNYGFGSTGLGVFRELVTHIKTTNWVLEGVITNFPLMYHYRIMPSSNQRVPSEMEHWGNHAKVQKYVLDRAIANYELVLVLEHIPHVLDAWLHEHPDKLQYALNDLCRTIAFLRKQGIIHFDAHFRNVLTDGEQIYLTDFGLVMDRSFTLAKDEQIFFEQNTFYDYGEILRNLGHLVRSPYYVRSEQDRCKIMEKYGIKAGLQPYEVGALLLDHIEQIQADGDLKLDEFYVACIVKYRRIIALMQSFFTEMWGNDRKDTKLPHTELQGLLEETGFLSDADSESK